MDAWGFGYRSHLIWAKDRIGTGYWNRNQHELLLIGVKGDIPAPLPGTQPPSILDAPVGAHSEKPPFAHEYAELCWPSLPKIELNARTARPGWDVWGAESPDAATGDEVAGDGGGPDDAQNLPAARSGLDGGAEGGRPNDDAHPEYGPDYNLDGFLRGRPAETLIMPQRKSAGMRAEIYLHPYPNGSEPVWMWATGWTGRRSGERYAISPKWRNFAPTRDAALKAAITEIAGRLGKSTGVLPAADKAIMRWLEDLAREAGSDAALPARAAAKGRMARRKGAQADASTQTEGEAA